MLPQSRRRFWRFPRIKGFGSYSFIPLTPKNSAQLAALFIADDSLFTDERFRSEHGALEYAQHIKDWGAFSPKHGGKDWLLKRGDEYLGVLHLYNRSLETFCDNHRRCWIGFAIKPSVRQQGIMKEVLRYFIAYIWDAYPAMQYIHAMTMPENRPTRALLRSVGFREDDERAGEKYAFCILERNGENR